MLRRAWVAQQPADLPVPLAQAKLWLRLAPGQGEEDPLLSALLRASREHVETLAGVRIGEQTIAAEFDHWPAGRDPLPLPYPPALEIVSVVTRDAAGDPVTVDPELYELRSSLHDAELHPPPGRQGWRFSGLPFYHGARGPLVVTYLAGTGGLLFPHQERHLQAIRVALAHFYDHRGDTSLPPAVRALAQAGAPAVI